MLACFLIFFFVGGLYVFAHVSVYSNIAHSTSSVVEAEPRENNRAAREAAAKCVVAREWIHILRGRADKCALVDPEQHGEDEGHVKVDSQQNHAPFRLCREELVGYGREIPDNGDHGGTKGLGP